MMKKTRRHLKMAYISHYNYIDCLLKILFQQRDCCFQCIPILDYWKIRFKCKHLLKPSVRPKIVLDQEVAARIMITCNFQRTLFTVQRILMKSLCLTFKFGSYVCVPKAAIINSSNIWFHRQQKINTTTYMEMVKYECVGRGKYSEITHAYFVYFVTKQHLFCWIHILED